MKKVATVEQNYCDGCGKQQDYLTGCMSCGVEHCYDCTNKLGKDYKHGVYVSGSGDGYYCKPCDVKLEKAGTDKRFQAYREVAALRAEAAEWGAAFDRKRKAAEAAVEAFRVR